jgi:hypothetical protein
MNQVVTQGGERRVSPNWVIVCVPQSHWAGADASPACGAPPRRPVEFVFSYLQTWASPCLEPRQVVNQGGVVEGLGEWSLYRRLSYHWQERVQALLGDALSPNPAFNGYAFTYGPGLKGVFACVTRGAGGAWSQHQERLALLYQG